MDKNEIQKKALEVKEKAEKMVEKEIDKIKKEMEKAVKKASDFAKKNPERAALISAGIGATLGAALAMFISEKSKKKK